MARDSENLVELVGANVRRLRQRRGWTQEELADHTGVSRTYISYVETTGKNFSLEVLEKLAAGLEVDPRELLRPANEQDEKPT